MNNKIKKGKEHMYTYVFSISRDVDTKTNELSLNVDTFLEIDEDTDYLLACWKAKKNSNGLIDDKKAIESFEKYNSSLAMMQLRARIHQNHTLHCVKSEDKLDRDLIEMWVRTSDPSQINASKI